MLKIKQINDKDFWEKFLTKKEIGFYPLFQSWNWGEVQRKLGFEILRLGIYESGSLLGICLLVDIKAKRGHFVHLRHGPVFLRFNERYLDFLLDYIKKLKKQKNISFIRLSPLLEKTKELDSFLKERGFRDSLIHNMDAEICWVMDIGKSEEQLIKEMRKTHRYLIRKAQTMNIRITRTTNVSKIDVFLNLYSDLSKRKGFVPHIGIKEEFGVFGKDNQALLFSAEYNRKIISSALVLFVGDMAIYRHGASSEEFRNVPVSYLLQWEAILEAKKRGKRRYNFWGVAPSDSKNHPWQGLTLFKTGFGGERLEFLHAQDLPLGIWYWKTYLIEYLAKKIKGY